MLDSCFYLKKNFDDFDNLVEIIDGIQTKNVDITIYEAI